MNKKTLITLSAFTGFGVVCAVVLVILLSLNIFAVSYSTVLLVLLILLNILAIWAPVLLNLAFKIKFNLQLVIAYEIFMIFALTIGCLWDVYEMSLVFDKFVHFASGVLFAMLAYNLITEAKGITASPVWTFIFTLSFAMLIGGFWEICEFSFDTFFNGNSQSWMGFEGRAILKDTMEDLICDFMGGVIGSIAVVVFEKFKSKKQALTENKYLEETEQCFI